MVFFSLIPIVLQHSATNIGEPGHDAALCGVLSGSALFAGVTQ